MRLYITFDSILIMYPLSPCMLSDVVQCCAHCTVRHQAVCGAMDDQQVRKLAQIAHRKKIPAGRAIISDEESVGFFANVISGAIKLTKMLPDGRQQIVGLLFAPDFLGRAYSKNNPYTAEAATEVELCTFPRAAFEELVKEYPDLQQRLLQQTLAELDAARDWMLLLGRKTAEEKVASFLYMLSRRSLMKAYMGKVPRGRATFELPLTRSDIADYLGLTIETVSRQLTRLKTSNVIHLTTSRFVMVPDLGCLAQAAGTDCHKH